jgi:hypothetical protein
MSLMRYDAKDEGDTCDYPQRESLVQIVIGIFIVLHGLVHLLYFAFSRRLIEVPMAGWPEGSWLFSHFLGDLTTRSLASVLFLLAMGLYVVSGASILLRANWWNPMLVSAALFSSAVVILFWDGKVQQMPEKGFVGLLINVVILAAVFFFRDSLFAF